MEWFAVDNEEPRGPLKLLDFDDHHDEFLVARMKAWFPRKYDTWRYLYTMAVGCSTSIRNFTVHANIKSLATEVHAYEFARRTLLARAKGLFDTDVAPYLDLKNLDTLRKFHTSVQTMSSFVILSSPKCTICCDNTVDAQIVRHCSSCTGATCRCPLRYCRHCYLKLLAEAPAARFACCPTCKAEFCPKDVVTLGLQSTNAEVLHLDDPGAPRRVKRQKRNQ